MNQDWNQNSPFPAEADSPDVKGFGGYAARHKYEKRKLKKKKILTTTVQGAILSVLVFLAVLGVVALFRGDFFGEKASSEAEAESGGTIKVPTQQELAGIEKEPEDVIADVELSLVTVEAILEDGSSRFGTGFFLSTDGHILCSDALFSDGTALSNLLIYTVEGSCFSATLTGTMPELGAALLISEGSIGSVAISVGNFSFLERGETLFAIGASNNKDFNGAAAAGIVSSVQGSVKVTSGGKTTTVPLLYLDILPNESLWGAPVVDNTGATVGFCTYAANAPFGNQTAVVSIHSLYTMVNQLLGESF